MFTGSSIKDSNVTNFISTIAEFKSFSNYNIMLVNITTHKNFFKINKINKSYAHWSKEVFYKVLFPSLNQLLYLDVDLIVKYSLTTFYASSMENKLFLGGSVGKYSHSNSKVGNINGGCLLLNLKQQRLEDTESKLINIILINNLQEEAAINNFFANRILYTNKFYYISKRQKNLL